ncbi:uncharacterized protein BROUX77_007235 [Berkeleyomyces rouxiae]|uniref:uncharacterized protein n=1 Tax=Berkeleyomyces rouxiae TaxID=2035830 RepID=UPI003B814A9C
MATRAERMQQRLRGAQRHQVEDVEFGSLFPTESFPVASLPEQAPGSTTEESSSPEPPAQQPPPATLPEVAQEASPEPEALPELQSPHSSPPPPPRRSPRNAPPRATSDPPDLPPYDTSAAVIDEVSESPTDAPGSGRRQRRSEHAAAASSARLQDVRDELELDSGAVAAAMLNSSSPLTRKSRLASRQRTRMARASRLSRMAGAGLGDDVDELSPDAERVRAMPEREIPALLEELPVARDRTPEEPATTRVDYSDGDVAEEIGDEEAARVLLRGKRQRQESPELPSETPERVDSPVLGAEASEVQPSPSPTPELEDQPPPPKRSRRSHADPLSPSQSQSQSQSEPRRKPQRKAPKAKRIQSADVSERLSHLDEKTTIPIAVQRFSAPSKASQPDDPDADTTMISISKIPCTSRSGVNTIDVLSQVCEEVLDTSLAQLLTAAASPEAAASAKKEYKAKIRALEAFQQELRSRLLQHTIYLDALHALKKRVRQAAADKARLRADVLRLRAEKDQLALRVDAARDTHDANSHALRARLDMSAAMHAVEAALAKGAGAPEVSADEARDAELVNLELVVARVAEQASSRGPGGGALNQIREFNRFLERAARALESR